MMNWEQDVITTAPTLTGPAGRAWDAALDQIAPGKKRLGSVSLWVVEAPRYHPIWHSYAISLLHFRHIEGVPDARIYNPNGTHEIVLFAMDPGFPRQPMLDGGEGHLLGAPNFVGQFAAVSDTDAAERVQNAVRDIVMGTLSPDTDFRFQWVERFGDHMLKGRG